MAEMISDIVEIHSGYTSYVDIKLELLDDSRNIARMSRYRPIKSHREAFEKLGRSLNVKDKRCYLLTGSYGTGKSHLCLMFANYLQTPAGEQPMPQFFANYDAVDHNAAETLKSKRGSGHYLIALCEWGGRGDFDEIVLRAINEALHREGFAEDFDTIYLQAAKKIEEWQKFDQGSDLRGRFFNDFHAALQDLSPPQTVASFLKRLREFNYDALDEFKRIHVNITTAPFTYDKSNLLPILTSTLASDKFKERFLGMLVLFDEFGYSMEQGNLNPKMFQQLAQLAAETPKGCAPLIFVGTAHKPLTAYAKAYSTTDFRVASDRIEEVPLTPDGIEDIISAIVEPQKTHPLWVSKVAPRTSAFDSFLTDCKRLKLFDWLDGPRVRKNIIENIYPMHPMATYALLQLSRDIASNNRSVYTFFSGDLGGESDDGSYGHFIANTPIESNGKLNLYTADLLYEYFKNTLNPDNKELRDTIREIVKDYENSRRELNRVASQDATTRIQFLGDPLIDQLLRLMLIYEIVQVPSRLENLIFGLYRTTATERSELQGRLEELAKKGVLYFDKNTGSYEFKKSKSVDLDRLIDEYKQEFKNIPANIVAELSTLVPLDKKSELYMEAKDYNQPFGEDKKLERRLVRPADLGSEVDTPHGKRSFFEHLEDELDKAVRKSDYEGFALYAVCQTQDEIQKVRDYCARNQSDRIVVAVPKNPVPLLDAVMELRALMHIENGPDAQNFTMQDRAALNARLSGDSNRAGARDTLKNLRLRLMNPKEVIWLGKYAGPLSVDENKPYDAANRVMETLYSDFRNKFAHDDFNFLHVKIDRSKNPGLKEAIEKLLDYTSTLTLDTSFAQNRGDIRYLQKCLLNNGVLRQIKPDGTKIRCEFETSTAKYEIKLPSLAAMITEVRELQPGKTLNLLEWLTKYRKHPYGQGPIALAVSIAVIRHLFGDSIRVKPDTSAIGELAMNSFDVVTDLIEGQYPNAFLSYRPLRDEEKQLADVVFDVFGQVDSAASAARNYTVLEAYNAVNAWWEGLSPLARVAKLYPASEHGYTARCIEALEKIAARDPHSFLFDDIPEAFGYSAGLVTTQDTIDAIKTNFPLVKQALERALDRVEERIFDGVRDIFGVQQQTYSDILQAINTWYNSLDTNQQNSYAKWPTKDSKPLVVHLKTITDVRETFLERIPASTDYGMKRVADWGNDRVVEYIERLRRGKAQIDDARLKVDLPEIKLAGDYEDGGGQVSFNSSVNVSFIPKNKGDSVYVTEGTADPTSSTATREQVNGQEPLVIRETKTIRYAVQDLTGAWSPVEELRFVNESKKFELSFQKTISKDERASFTFPQDAQSFEIACRSLFTNGLQRKAITVKEIEERVRAILDELRKA